MAVSPVLMHWRYSSLALSHWDDIKEEWKCKLTVGKIDWVHCWPFLDLVNGILQRNWGNIIMPVDASWSPGHQHTNELITDSVLVFHFKQPCVTCVPLFNSLRIMHYAPFYPSALRAGGVLSSRFGLAGGQPGGGYQTCGTHISVTAWRIFSIRSSVELSRPVVVHCHGHLPICPIWACPWAKNL